MPKTKLANRVEAIRKIKSYRNPRCDYSWSLSNVGYCWAYANWIDYKNGTIDFISDEYKVDDCIEFCKDCEYWKGRKNYER